MRRMNKLRVVRPDGEEDLDPQEEKAKDANILARLHRDLNRRLLLAGDPDVSPEILLGAGNGDDMRQLLLAQEAAKRASDLRNNPPNEMLEQKTTPPERRPWHPKNPR